MAASAAGYRKALKIFDVPTTTGLYLFLEEERGTLTISTTPSGGNITVDGRPWPQKTPASLALPPGKYSIKLDYEGFATEVRVVVINDRESPHLSADFRPLLERNAAEKSDEQR